MVCIRPKTQIKLIKALAFIFLASLSVKQALAEQMPQEFVIGHQSYPTPEIVAKDPRFRTFVTFPKRAGLSFGTGSNYGFLLERAGCQEVGVKNASTLNYQQSNNWYL